MTAPASPSAAGAGAPHPAAPKRPPPLALRADRPAAVRLRRAVAQGVVVAGALLLSGSLAWAFVIQPELRGRSHPAPGDGMAGGKVRPSELVTGRPGAYDRLPAPRRPFAPEGAEAPADAPPDRPAPPPAAPGPTAPSRSAVAHAARTSGLFFVETGASGRAGSAAAAPVAAEARLDRDYAAAYSRHSLLPALSPYELKAGAVVPAALLTAIDTTRAGPVVATVTADVYDSVSGRHLLLPRGARLIGAHEGDSDYGERRAFIAWRRLILPNGKSLLLDDEPGVDAQGAVGVTGQADRRLGQLVMATLFAGAIGPVGQAARDRDGDSGGVWGDAGDAASVAAAQTGGRLIERELKVSPRIRLAAGAPVRVLLTRDLILEPYRP